MTMAETTTPHTLGTRLASLVPRLACPNCHGAVRPTEGALVCERCARRYPVVGEMAVLLDEESAAEINSARDGAENVRLRTSLRQSGMLRFADAMRPPHPFLFLNGRRNRGAFSELVPAGNDTVVLDIGSGLLKGLNASGLSERVYNSLIPLEIAPGPGIGVVGDAHKLPFCDGALDGVLIQGVLEHVRDPERIAGEIWRVLKPGAPVYVDVPFVQHYHLDPFDFRRYTVYGIEHLFARFERVDSGVAAGPASALADMLTEFPALLFRSPMMYWGVKFVTGWLTSPIRFLDVFWSKAHRAHIASGAVYYLGRKPAA